MARLELSGVTRRFGSVTALDDVSLDVAEGELLCVLGPSGSGKSTLLRVVAGLDDLDAGEIRIGQRPMRGVDPSRRDVAMVFQSFALFPHLTVEENIGFGLAARGRQRDEQRRAVAEAAAALDLDAKLDRRPSELSGGERQRVALARALVRRPALLLLDEPLSNLDARLRLETRTELRRVHDTFGLTSVHVTHDQAEALSLGDRVAILNAGRLEQVGPPDDVYDRPASAWVAAFLGSPPMNLMAGSADAGVLRVADAECALRASSARGPVTVGVRPEHVMPRAPDGSAANPSANALRLPATLSLIESIGHERLWYAESGAGRIVARVGLDRSGTPGDRVLLELPADALRLFDAGSGAAL